MDEENERKKRMSSGWSLVIATLYWLVIAALYCQLALMTMAGHCHFPSTLL